MKRNFFMAGMIGLVGLIQNATPMQEIAQSARSMGDAALNIVTIQYHNDDNYFRDPFEFCEAADSVAYIAFLTHGGVTKDTLLNNRLRLFCGIFRVNNDEDKKAFVADIERHIKHLEKEKRKTVILKLMELIIGTPTASVNINDITGKATTAGLQIIKDVMHRVRNSAGVLYLISARLLQKQTEVGITDEELLDLKAANIVIPPVILGFIYGGYDNIIDRILAGGAKAIIKAELINKLQAKGLASSRDDALLVQHILNGAVVYGTQSALKELAEGDLATSMTTILPLFRKVCQTGCILACFITGKKPSQLEGLLKAALGNTENYVAGVSLHSVIDKGDFSIFPQDHVKSLKLVVEPKSTPTPKKSATALMLAVPQNEENQSLVVNNQFLDTNAIIGTNQTQQLQKDMIGKWKAVTNELYAQTKNRALNLLIFREVVNTNILSIFINKMIDVGSLLSLERLAYICRDFSTEYKTTPPTPAITTYENLMVTVLGKPCSKLSQILADAVIADGGFMEHAGNHFCKNAPYSFGLGSSAYKKTVVYGSKMDMRTIITQIITTATPTSTNFQPSDNTFSYSYFLSAKDIFTSNMLNSLHVQKYKDGQKDGAYFSLQGTDNIKLILNFSKTYHDGKVLRPLNLFIGTCYADIQ